MNIESLEPDARHIRHQLKVSMFAEREHHSHSPSSLIGRKHCCSSSGRVLETSCGAANSSRVRIKRGKARWNEIIYVRLNSNNSSCAKAYCTVGKAWYHIDMTLAINGKRLGAVD